MIGELIMRCFHARTNAHVLHLTTTSYAKHNALKDFYEGIVDLVDDLAEAYTGEYGVPESFPGRFTLATDPIAMITELDQWIKANRHKCWDSDDTHLDNIVDEIVQLNRSTLYKLKRLK